VQFEWDEAKRFGNMRKHGVDFARVEAFEWGTIVEVQDQRRPYGETRWQALGMIDERLHMLIYARRNGRIRVISLRKASDMEIAAYENKTEAEHS
jgi:uncharacterized DUF497 family protein